MNHFTLIQCAAHFTAKEYGIARSYKPASDSRSHFHDLSREIVPPAQRPLPPSLADHPVLGIETRVLENPGPGETSSFCQTRNPGL